MYEYSKLRQATKEFDVQVENEAIKLVKQGIPLWNALEKARKIVANRNNYQKIKDNSNFFLKGKSNV